MAILADKIEIRIEGKTYNNYVFSNIHLIQEVGKPNELRFYMCKNTLIEDEEDIRFSLSSALLGSAIDYTVTTVRDDEDKKSHNDSLYFTGIIFNVNSIRSNMGAGMVIEVVAYSPDYLLQDNPHCYSFENENLKNIVSKVLEPYNIPAKIEPAMAEDAAYIVQYNETNYRFLDRLAQRFGEWMYYDGKKFVFGEIEKTDCIDLQPDYDILNYQYRLDMKHLNFSHARHDYLNYQNPTGQASAFTGQAMHGMTDIVFDQSQSIYTKKTFQHLHGGAPEANTFDETEFSVKAQGLGKKAQMMICSGSTNRADLKIGSVIRIKEYFEKENNKKGVCYHDELLICKITHKADCDGSYENEFVAIAASGKYPAYSFRDCCPKIENQRAVVIDNKDPQQLGRIRVQFLWQQEQDDSLTTPWIRMAQPHGGDNKGFYFIPEIDEEVMVGFENGNAEKPYVIGTLYHGRQHPGSNWPNDGNDIKAIRTRNGHTVEIHDEAEGGFIRIYDNEKENYILTFSTDEKLIKLESTGNIELYAQNDIIMEAGNNINMKAGENINETAGTDITTDAGNNISTHAKENITVDAGKDISEKASKNFTTSSGENTTMNVGESMDISVNQNMDIAISDKYTVEATDILQDANGKVQLYAGSTWEQKADNSMKIDGGSKMNFAADMLKFR